MTKNRNPEPRIDGHTHRSDNAGYALPEDFEDRLDRHRETSGLTWNVLARAMDVDCKDRRRRRGDAPSGRIGGKR